MRTEFSEIRYNYFDDLTCLYYFDGYRTDDDNEEGEVVATMDAITFVVTFSKPHYKNDYMVINAINEKYNELIDILKEKSEKLFHNE